MDGIQNILGREITLTLKGKTYRLTEKTLSEYAEQEAHICSLKPSPLALLKDLPPLPDKPALPVPPDVKTQTADQVRAYQQATLDYKEAERNQLNMVAARGRMEDRLFQLAGRPRVASVSDVDEFEFSVHGWSWRLWRAIRTHHPEFETHLHVRRWIEPIAKQSAEDWVAIQYAVYEAEGYDLLKNSPPPANGGTTNQAEPPGPDSSGVSQTDTSGPTNTSAA